MHIRFAGNSYTNSTFKSKSILKLLEKQVLTIVSAFIAIEHCLRVTLGDLIEVTHLLEDLACCLVFRVSLPYDLPTIVKIVQ